MEIAVCDTSTLIKLNKVDSLDILGELFDVVYIPKGVQEECLDDHIARSIKKPFLKVQEV